MRGEEGDTEQGNEIALFTRVELRLVQWRNGPGRALLSRNPERKERRNSGRRRDDLFVWRSGKSEAAPRDGDGKVDRSWVVVVERRVEEIRNTEDDIWVVSRRGKHSRKNSAHTKARRRMGGRQSPCKVPSQKVGYHRRRLSVASFGLTSSDLARQTAGPNSACSTASSMPRMQAEETKKKRKIQRPRKAGKYRKGHRLAM